MLSLSLPVFENMLSWNFYYRTLTMELGGAFPNSNTEANQNNFR